jgi:tetratricopeptide (TPR) repeat protein
MQFRAFISYSHVDAAWATWLLRRLETYRVPSGLVGKQGAHGIISRRLGTFFRDRDELPSAGDLGATIRAALADSDALVVIGSPTAAQSRWVDAEIEAFQAQGRGDRVLCFVVDGVPGSTDPAQNCFPPALLRPDAAGVAREPLAADARAEGDGRERAFLKLVAGLLGIGYDALARRESQRRNRRLAIVAAASLAGMAITSGLAASAYLARNDAQRRQAQAEDILGFMLGDLRKKLTTVGRLDLMRAVDDKATGYFATLDPRDMSDRALEEQARSLTGIGEVRLGEGNHDAAMTAFREAHARSTALYQRAPEKGQRLFDLAQAEYWIGHVAWQQGRLDDAETWFRKYRDSAVRLAAMDRGNFAWQKEVAYGHQNLAALDESRGRYAEAERAMLELLMLYRGWVRQRPADLELRFEAANTASWVGSLALRLGQLANAEAHFIEQVKQMRRNLAEDPGNAKWKENSADALLLLADAQAQRGRLADARISVEAASPIAARLVAQDPANNPWRELLGRCRWSQAQLEAAEQPARAAMASDQAASLLAAAHAAEPKSERVLSWLVKARNQQAQLALARGDTASARKHLSDAQAVIEPAWQAEQNEVLRLWLARTRLLEGEVAQQEGNPAQAAVAWTQARQLLLADAATPLPFARLDPLVRALQQLGQSAEAAPHRQRLDAAGYVPLRPFSDVERIARQ